MSPLAVMFVLVLVSVAVTVATSLPLLGALLGAAFLVPGGAGVQEAGYVGLGVAFGLPPEVALGVSLLRRARDLAFGVPILAVWQWTEWRRLRG